MHSGAVRVSKSSTQQRKIRLQVGSDQADFNVDAEIVSETAMEEVRSRTHGEERSSASSLTTENTLRLTKRERR
jgi:hypothetical protein